jgi:hypothetical protein
LLLAATAVALSTTTAGAAVSTLDVGGSSPAPVVTVASGSDTLLITETLPTSTMPSVRPMSPVALEQLPIDINQAVVTGPVTRRSSIDPFAEDAKSAMISRILKAQETISTLAGVADDEDGNPLGDFSYLSVGPTSFTQVRSGKPGGQAMMWPHTMDSALSYVRPHRNLGFVVNFHGSEGRSVGGATPEEGPMEAWSGGQQRGQGMVDANAQFIDGLKVDLDTSRMVEASAGYGRMGDAPGQDRPHPGRMIAFGLDLGLVPAVLADVGISTTITIGESTNPGPFIAIATNIEVPNQKTRELTVANNFQVMVDLQYNAWDTPHMNFASGFAAEDDDGGGGDDDDDPTPITPDPPVPEPATMALLALGTAALMARKRMTGSR